MAERAVGLVALDDLACPCCGEAEVNPLLLDGLNELAWWARRPVVVVSGYRCAERNQAVGGEANSFHVKGMAADIHVPELSLPTVLELILQVAHFRLGGVGVYPDQRRFHVDVRRRPARWGRLNGRYVALDQALRAQAA